RRRDRERTEARAGRATCRRRTGDCEAGRWWRPRRGRTPLPRRRTTGLDGSGGRPLREDLALLVDRLDALEREPVRRDAPVDLLRPGEVDDLAVRALH